MTSLFVSVEKVRESHEGVKEMKSIDVPMLLLAMCVVLMFSAIGVAIAFKSILFIILCTLLGFAFMGYGIRVKVKRRNSH